MLVGHFARISIQDARNGTLNYATLHMPRESLRRCSRLRLELILVQWEHESSQRQQGQQLKVDETVSCKNHCSATSLSECSFEFFFGARRALGT
jgi:hypothetical protein